MNQSSSSSLLQPQISAPAPTMLYAESYMKDISTPDQSPVSVSLQPPPPANSSHAPEISTPDQIPVSVSAQAPDLANSPPVPEQHTAKNQLQELAHKLKLPLPIYKTVELAGSTNFPSFRSEVTVGDRVFISQSTFSKKKEAEKDAAKLALERLPQEYAEHDYTASFPIILGEITMFCKSILNELSVKINGGTAKYDTTKVEGFPLWFVSTLLFNGVTYTGGNAKCKKEAEQLAARVAIQSLLGDSEVGKTLNDIIKSKIKLYAKTLKKRTNFSVGAPLGTDSAPSNDSDAQPKHYFKLQNVVSSDDAVPANLPIEFVHPRPSLDLNIGPSPKKLRQV